MGCQASGLGPCGSQVSHGGIGYQRGIKAFGLAALVEDGQVGVGAVLVAAADAAQRAFGQALGLEEDWFVLRLRLGHRDHQYGLAGGRECIDSLVEPD